MHAVHAFLALKSDDDWGGLPAKLGLEDRRPLRALLEDYRALGALGCIVEAPYIDRDFSAAFTAFYAGLFHPYRKDCTRVHFFGADVSPLEHEADAVVRASNIAALQPNYLGYAVLRPLRHAPISSAVVTCSTDVAVRAPYKVHLLGAELLVIGAPLTQQDTRVGACAQASIWTVGRHFHQRHGASWFSMPAISDLALTPTDGTLSTSLPQGSSFLRLDNMVRALRAMDRSPVVYAAKGVTAQDQLIWDRPTPSEVVTRYVDSGIPVIVVLRPKGPDLIGHAVVAVGFKKTQAVDLTSLADAPTLAAGLSEFLINDDQRGAYLSLPIDAAPTANDWALNADCTQLIVPLPGKVFVPAETADVLARDVVVQIEAARSTGRLVAPKRTDFEPAQLLSLASNAVVSRTYLTYGWKYKARALRNELSAEFKAVVATKLLPRFVWVTEFSLPSLAFNTDQCSRKVIAHVVVDATGSKFWNSVLLAEVPGVGLELTPSGYLDFATDRVDPYYGKIRGEMDFEHCAVSKA